ncbi:MAG: DUF2512 family protein [Solirubrobacterales bacterium]
MQNLLVKLVLFPAIVWLSTVIFTQVHYASFAQILGVGWAIAVLSYFADEYLIVHNNFTGDRQWWPLAGDFIIAMVVVWASSGILPGARITFLGAAFTTILLTIAEYAIHQWLFGRLKDHAGGDTVD